MCIVEVKLREWCELPSSPLVDETKSGSMCWMHVCTVAFALWKYTFVRQNQIDCMFDWSSRSMCVSVHFTKLCWWAACTWCITTLEIITMASTWQVLPFANLSMPLPFVLIVRLIWLQSSMWKAWHKGAVSAAAQTSSYDLSHQVVPLRKAYIHAQVRGEV